jgi:uncharacterized surface protein with fasciclin (FAS1) repeats
MSSDVDGSRTYATTVNGAKLTVNAIGKGVRVDDANVIAADIGASNGVIHVIDTVCMPPQS